MLRTYVSLLLTVFWFCLSANGILQAQGTLPPPTEADYYRIVTLPIPEGVVLEVGGLTTLPDGRIAASTRRGDVWLIDNAYMEDGLPPRYKRFATGLHEALGLAWHDGAFYLAQRGELTRLRDTDGDEVADRYETVYAWPLSGHYHEYSFGPKIAPDGSFFVTTNVAFGDVEWWRGESRVPWRGWTLRITPDGQMEPWATGMRSPAGLGIIDGEFFYADNQGDWVGSGGLVHVEKGDFTGHPAGLRWATRPESPVKLTEKDIYYRVSPRFTPPGKRPVKPENIPDERPTPLFELAQDLPAIKLPAVWLPHGVLGISNAEILVDTTGGKFGPFAGQVFIGDQGQSKIVRVFLEKVEGVYQGAAFAFREGFQSGVLRMTWGKDGSLFVGQTNRGWGSTGPDPYGLQRLVWTGRVPFEMKAVRAMPDGFEIEFTRPVDKATAARPESYEVSSFIYKYHPVYGSPAVNVQTCPVRYVEVSRDGLRARLVVDSLRQFYIHEIKATGVRDYMDGWPLLHPVAYYTLNRLPKGEKLKVPRPQPPAPEKESATPAHSHAPAPKAETKDVQPNEPAPASAKTEQPARKAAPAPKTARPDKHPTRMPASWGGKVDYALTLGTKPGLQYDKTTLTVKAGSRVKLAFFNNDDMPHNVVITLPGKADAVGKAAMNLGIKGADMQYVPNMPEVLWHTKLVGPGGKDVIYFRAPEKPGFYQFVCTFPGHYLTMRGVLRVIP